jgi:hypothetical protein
VSKQHCSFVLVTYLEIKFEVVTNNSSFQAQTSQYNTWEFISERVEKLKAEIKASAESITQETWTAVTTNFNFFSAKGTGCRGSVCILRE